MERYRNLNRNSGIHAYEIGNDNIKVFFTDGGIYLYDDNVTGSENILRMKALANSGYGLNSFIKKYVNKKYAAKLR